MADREDPTFRMPNTKPMTAEFYNNLPSAGQQFISGIAGKMGKPVESLFAPGAPQTAQQPAQMQNQQPQQSVMAQQMPQFPQGGFGGMFSSGWQPQQPAQQQQAPAPQQNVQSRLSALLGSSPQSAIMQDNPYADYKVGFNY